MPQKYPLSDIGQLKPNQMKCVEVRNTRIVVARVGDDYYAFDELCSHEDFPLWYGAVKDHRVECSLHGAQFDIRDGRPVHEPATQPIKTYPVSMENGTLYVEIDD